MVTNEGGTLPSPNWLRPQGGASGAENRHKRRHSIPRPQKLLSATTGRRRETRWNSVQKVHRCRAGRLIKNGSSRATLHVFSLCNVPGLCHGRGGKPN